MYKSLSDEMMVRFQCGRMIAIFPESSFSLFPLVKLLSREQRTGVGFGDHESGLQPLLFQHPFSVLSNFFVHGIRSKVNLARPSHHSNLDTRLCEQGRIAQDGEDAGLVRKDEARHINRSFHAIKETDLKLIAREDSDFRYAP
jgi:hypothetical protein